MKARFSILLSFVLALTAAADEPVRYHDDGLGIAFDLSPDFEAVQFTHPEFSDAEATAVLPLGLDLHFVGLVEKHLFRNPDPQAVRAGQIPAILLNRPPAFQRTGGDPGGVMEIFLKGKSPRRIGGRDAYELSDCWPGHLGKPAFCWVVSLPATRRELPPEEGMEPVGVPVPEGWLVISAPCFFEPDDDAPTGTARRPTGYDREIRRILETLSIDGAPEGGAE